MKAVNLIPNESRRGGGTGSITGQLPTYAVLGVLAVALAFVTVYVLASNSISDKKAKITSLQQQLAQVQAQTSNLVNYSQFQQLVASRTTTVQNIAGGRYDWNGALTDLSKVVPANTSLQTLNASAGSAPGSSSPGGGSGSALLSAIPGPAVELTGCTKTQDDVARLMARLRLIDGVTSVTLGTSQKSSSAQAATSVASGSAGGSVQAVGCGTNAPNFDLVMAFQPLATAATPTGVPGATPATGAAPASTTAGTTSTTAGATTTTTASGTAPPASTTTAATTSTTAAATTAAGGSQ